MFEVTSAFTLTGDANQTLNTLTDTPVTGETDLSKLSTNNYPVADEKTPNAENQLIFMNQPLSWWVASLNSGAVKYTPYSNFVNWAYVQSPGNLVHIGMPISNLLLPNKTAGVTRTPGTMGSVITFESKFGLGRVDTHAM